MYELHIFQASSFFACVARHTLSRKEIWKIEKFKRIIESLAYFCQNSENNWIFSWTIHLGPAQAAGGLGLDLHREAATSCLGGFLNSCFYRVFNLFGWLESGTRMETRSDHPKFNLCRMTRQDYIDPVQLGRKSLMMINY